MTTFRNLPDAKSGSSNANGDIQVSRLPRRFERRFQSPPLHPDHSTMASDVMPMVKVRQRASHRKSRRGCLTCKQRHRKCDETLPTCKRCLASGRPCIRSPEESSPTSPKTRGFRGFKIIQYNLPPAVPNASPCMPEHSSLDYFTIHTLTFLQRCQPSSLWTSVIGDLIQSRDCFRTIASAIGSQQRLAVDRNHPERSHSKVEQEANDNYLAAVRSIRSSVTTPDFSNDTLLPALACLLMVILESLRESTAGVSAHLRYGIQLASRENVQNGTPEFFDAIRMIRQVGVSSMLTPPASVWPRCEIADLMWSASHRLPAEAVAPSPNDLSYLSEELTAIINDLLLAYHVRSKSLYAAAHIDFYASVSRLWPRLTRVQRLLEECKTQVLPDMTIFYELLNSRAEILHAQMEIAWTDAPGDSPYHLHKTEAVLRRLHLCISLLEEAGYGSTFPFSIGTGLIPTLYLVATSTCTTRLRNEVAALISRCPSREGLWYTNEYPSVFGVQADSPESLESGSCASTDDVVIEVG